MKIDTTDRHAEGVRRHEESVNCASKLNVPNMPILNGVSSSFINSDSKKLGKIRFGFNPSALSVSSQIFQTSNGDDILIDDSSKIAHVPMTAKPIVSPVKNISAENAPKITANLPEVEPIVEIFLTKTTPTLKFAPNPSFYKNFCSLYTSHKPKPLPPLPPQKKVKNHIHRSEVQKPVKRKKRPHSSDKVRRETKVERHKIRKTSIKTKSKHRDSSKKRTGNKTKKTSKQVVATQKKEEQIQVSPVRSRNRDLLSPVSPNENFSKEKTPTVAEPLNFTSSEDQSCPLNLAESCPLPVAESFPFNLADIPLPNNNFDQSMLHEEQAPYIFNDDQQMNGEHFSEVQPSSNNILDLSAEICKANENLRNSGPNGEHFPPISQLMNEYDLFEAEIFKTNVHNDVSTNAFDSNENCSEKLSTVINDSQCFISSPNSTPLVDELSVQEKDEPVRLISQLRKMTTNPKMLSIIERLNALLDEKRLVMVDNIGKAPSTSSAAECTSVEVIGHDADHDSPDIVPNLSELVRDPRLRRHLNLDCDKKRSDQNQPQFKLAPDPQKVHPNVEQKLLGAALTEVDQKSIKRRQLLKKESAKKRKRRRSRRSPPPPPPPPPRRDKLKTQRAAVNTPPVQNLDCVDPNLMVQSTSNVQAFNANNMFAFDQQSDSYYHQYPYQQPQQQQQTQFFFVPVASYRAVYQTMPSYQHQSRLNPKFYGSAGVSNFTPTPKSFAPMLNGSENTNTDRHTKLAGSNNNSQIRKDDGRFAVPAPKRFTGPIKKRYL